MSSVLFNEALKKENTSENIEKNIKKYHEVILPFYEHRGTDETFLGAEGIPVSCRIFHTQNASAKILISTGFNESYIKYAECIMDLCNMGFSVYCFDHRGQGFSGRFPEQKQIAYVDKFKNYVADLSSFFHNVRNSHEKNIPLFILSHSMGSAVCMLALYEHKIKPAGIILCSPMFEICFTPYRVFDFPLYLFVKSLSSLGFDKKFIVGAKDFTLHRQFEKNHVTHSKFRFAAWSDQILTNPKMQLEGPSFGWLKEAASAARKLRFIKRSDTRGAVPVLLLQAEVDSVVRNSAQDFFVNNNSYIEKIVFPHAKHELLMEIDFVRERVIECIKKFCK